MVFQDLERTYLLSKRLFHCNNQKQFGLSNRLFVKNNDGKRHDGNIKMSWKDVWIAGRILSGTETHISVERI